MQLKLPSWLCMTLVPIHLYILISPSILHYAVFWNLLYFDTRLILKPSRSGFQGTVLENIVPSSHEVQSFICQECFTLEICPRIKKNPIIYIGTNCMAICLRPLISSNFFVSFCNMSFFEKDSSSPTLPISCPMLLRKIAVLSVVKRFLKSLWHLKTNTFFFTDLWLVLGYVNTEKKSYCMRWKYLQIDHSRYIVRNT